MLDEHAILAEGLRAAVATIPTLALPQAARLALALLDGPIAANELWPFVGKTWVLARRTVNIVRRYGPDVNCLSPQQLDAAYVKALHARLES